VWERDLKFMRGKKAGFVFKPQGLYCLEYLGHKGLLFRIFIFKVIIQSPQGAFLIIFCLELLFI
jgi:hypothetical protein